MLPPCCPRASPVLPPCCSRAAPAAPLAENFSKNAFSLLQTIKNIVVDHSQLIELEMIFLSFFCKKFLKENRRAVLLESSEEGLRIFGAYSVIYIIDINQFYRFYYSKVIKGKPGCSLHANRQSESSESPGN